MNKYLNRILLVLLILFTLGFGCYCLISAARTDSTVPEISFTADTVSVSVGDDPAALLAGILKLRRQHLEHICNRIVCNSLRFLCLRIIQMRFL